MQIEYKEDLKVGQYVYFIMPTLKLSKETPCLKIYQGRVSEIKDTWFSVNVGPHNPKIVIIDGFISVPVFTKKKSTILWLENNL
jgi:hypothetical protein